MCKKNLSFKKNKQKIDYILIFINRSCQERNLMTPDYKTTTEITVNDVWKLLS